MANKINIGDLNVGTVKLGSSDVTMYLGDNLLYPYAVKLKTTYTGGYKRSINCDDNPILTSGDTDGSGVYSSNNILTAEIGECVTSISGYAFSTCSSLSSVTIPNTVTSIGTSAFADCDKLTGITIPDSVTSIGIIAFVECSGMTSATFGSGLTTIGDESFRRCYGLTSINIPDNVTTIGSAAFRYSSGLTSVIIGSGVTNIKSSAFRECSGLTSVEIHATTPPTLGNYAFDDTNNCPIYVPCDSVDAYKAASGWSNYASRITCIPSCNDLVLPDGDSFTANTTDKSIQIPYGGVSSNDITVKECGEGYLNLDSIDSNYIYLNIVNSPKDGAWDCITIQINGDKCATIYVDFVDSGGGQIPMGTDMVQYYGRHIKRIEINDTTVPSNFNRCVINDWNSQSYIDINQWGTYGTGEFSGINSLPIHSTPSNPVRLEKWEFTDGSYQQSTINPFYDLRIEWI